MSTDTPVKDHTGQSLQFLQSHTYFTDYCRKLLTEGKAKNMELLKKNMQGKYQ